MENVITPVDTKTRKNLDMKTGDTVRVFQKIQEKGKTRLQAFEGLVLARKHGTEAGATFTVRRDANGFGVEKIFPLFSPMIDKIEIVKRSKTRQSKLYYVRDKALKEVKKRFKMIFMSHSTEDFKEEPVKEESDGSQEKPEIVDETSETTEEPIEEVKEEAPIVEEEKEETSKEEEKTEESTEETK
jgi:large subunit ribosomal protein L19